MTNKPKADSNICLATVCTEEFISGTLVMIHSFLKHNAWFQGDIVIIHSDLGSKHQECLTAIYNRIQFRSVSSKLDSRLQELLASRSDLANRKARFYSLDALNLTEYSKVLFCDSDLLFRQPVQDIFSMPDALICCGDGGYYQGHSLDSLSFLPVPDVPKATEGLLNDTFNAGLMLFDMQMLGDTAYREILAFLSKETWQPIKASQTDQVVYNLYFNGQQTIVSSHYNYLLSYHNAILTKEDVRLKDARVIHFNGPNKPWLINRLLITRKKDPVLILALKFWYEAYTECLTQLHFQDLLK